MTEVPPDSDPQLEAARQNLELLQLEVDRLYAENRAYRERIERLHAERETLRRRAHDAQAALARLGNRPGHRVRSFLSALLRGRIPLGKLPTRVRELGRRSNPPAPLGPTPPPFRRPEPTLSTRVPESTFPEPKPTRPDLRVAAVMDDFSRTAFSYEFDYVAINPETWRTDLAEPPRLLLVESAFGGNAGAWTNQVAGFCAPRAALAELTQWCRENGIPSVFWNKEDPVNFEWFIGAASAFDWVFTVDANAVPRYRLELGHDRVAPLPFAAQPAIHFPPATDGDRTGDIAFAGSYYARKHPERRQQMEYILEPALEFGLDIFDRMGSLDDPRFRWPDKYLPHLQGSLSYAQTTEAYRRYKVFLNVNTVTDSPTMCARRIFELLACGTPVVSGPSAAIDRMVPSGTVLISRSKPETAKHVAHLLSDAGARAQMSSAGQLWIADGNTYENRVAEIIGTVGVDL